MNYGELFNSGIHYHIRWSDSLLDWKPFATQQEAVNLAGRITKPDETYVIVERDLTCPRCKDFKAMAGSPASGKAAR